MLGSRNRSRKITLVPGSKAELGASLNLLLRIERLTNFIQLRIIVENITACVS
jgi:hypothetical protein